MFVARVLSAVLDKSFCKTFWYSSSIVNVDPTSVFQLLQEFFDCIFSSFSQWQHTYVPVMSIRTQSRAWGFDDSAIIFLLQHKYSVLHGSVCNYDTEHSSTSVGGSGCAKMGWSSDITTVASAHHCVIWSVSFLSELLHLLCHPHHNSSDF
jgi:hypothetical protein